MKVTINFGSLTRGKNDFIKKCHSIAKSVLGDSYDKDVTEETANGILRDHKDKNYDAKLSIFRNGLKS